MEGNEGAEREGKGRIEKIRRKIGEDRRERTSHQVQLRVWSDIDYQPGSPDKVLATLRLPVFPVR